MANSSFGSRILCASFNQDNSCFAIGTKDGFRLFDARSGRLRYERAIGAFSIVEMLFSTSLIAIVGAGEQPSLSPRRLCLFNFVTDRALKELNFLTTILAVRMNRKRLIVVLQEKTYIYEVNRLALLDTIDTVPNNKGLCAFAPNSEACYLALPASTTKGSALVYNTLELRSLCQIDAHRSPLAAIVFSSNGMYLATASEQGTIIRVHIVSKATKSYSLRRGSYPSTIYSLSFGPSVDLPDILVATSISGSLHTFSLGPIVEHRNRRPNKLLGSMIPEQINDAFESSYHHVVHNVSVAGVRSYVTVSSTKKVQSSSANSTILSNVYLITGDGHFYNYTLNISRSDEFSWSLQSEFNLIDTVA